MEKQNVTAKQKNGPVKANTLDQSQKKQHTFLPIVMTSSIARNRLDQMKDHISQVKSMNQNRAQTMQDAKEKQLTASQFSTKV